MHRLGWASGLFFLLPFAWGTSAPATGGPQFQVNSYTTSDQSVPSISIDTGGNFVVVWTSDGSSAGDILDTSIHGQRYAAGGAALGGEFEVNTYTPGRQNGAAVASDPSGNFVVVWASYGSDGSDTSLLSIQGQRYLANGSAQGPQFQVNTYTSNNQVTPAVAIDALGDFVVVWQSYGSYGGDTSQYSVQGQRYLADGSPAGGELQINTSTSLWQTEPSVAMADAGNFVVVWRSNQSTGDDNSLFSVQGQLFAASGSPSGSEFQVNTFTTNNQLNPAVAADSNGGFVVVWRSDGSSGNDSSSTSIQGQRYAPNGGPLGGEFQVNVYTTSYQQRPAVSRTATGAFAVAWESGGSSGGDTSTLSVQGRRYTSNGTPQGGQFQVNSYTTSYQGHSAVAMDSNGEFVVVWDSNGSSGGDTSAYSVQARRMAVLFIGDFESGDTSLWSATVP